MRGRALVLLLFGLKVHILRKLMMRVSVMNELVSFFIFINVVISAHL